MSIVCWRSWCCFYSALFLAGSFVVMEAALVSKETHDGKIVNRRERRKQFKKRPWSSRTQEFMANCTYWQDLPNYNSRWRKRKFIRDSFRTLHDKYDLRCAPKPEGPMKHMGVVSPKNIRKMIESAGEEVWAEDAWRQQKYKVHSETEAITLFWRYNVLDETEYKPRWSEWKDFFEPAFRKACDAYGYNYDEADVWKAMIARIPAGNSVKPHEDLAPALVFAHRIHWAISGEEGVKTWIGQHEVQLKDGDLFEFNNIRTHTVSNEGKNNRVHAIFDLIPKKIPPGQITLYEPDMQHYDYYDDTTGTQPAKNEL